MQDELPGRGFVILSVGATPYAPSPPAEWVRFEHSLWNMAERGGTNRNLNILKHSEAAAYGFHERFYLIANEPPPAESTASRNHGGAARGEAQKRSAR